MTISRVLGCAGAAAALTALAPLALATAAAAATPLKAYQVPASQVGKGYTQKTIEEGATLKEPTLQNCGETQASDKLRASRLQNQFSPPHKGGTFLSEEIVRYKAGDGAAARRDLAALRTLCPKPISFDNAAGGVTTTATTPITLKGLPAGAVAFKTVEGVKGGQYPHPTYTGTAVWMTRGDVLIGLYFGSSKNDKALGVKVAKLAAARLAKG